MIWHVVCNMRNRSRQAEDSSSFIENLFSSRDQETKEEKSRILELSNKQKVFKTSLGTPQLPSSRNPHSSLLISPPPQQHKLLTHAIVTPSSPSPQLSSPLDSSKTILIRLLMPILRMLLQRRLLRRTLKILKTSLAFDRFGGGVLFNNPSR